MEDEQLLRQYCETKSQEAFQTLVERHLGMVYCTARRVVGDPHLAEEVAQGAFAMLAEKGASVRRPQVVGGWLYATTRNLALHAVRSEQRRRERERTAAAMQSLNEEPNQEDVIAQLEPAMAELDDDDRGALVLRFLENRNLRDVGTELGISEDAARMRINRAIERLREVFARRGMAVSSALLAGVLAAAAANAIPTGLAASILAGTGAGAATTITIMSWINAKSAAAIAAAAILAGTAGYLSQKNTEDQLQARFDTAHAQLEQAKADALAAQKALAARDRELENLRPVTIELARSRNEIAQLRQKQRQAEQAAQAAAATPGSGNQKSAMAAPPGTHLDRGQITFAGYATPAATIQSLAWASVHGDTNVVERVVPADLPEGGKLVEELGAAMQLTGPFLRGLQVMAQKTLADGSVQLLVKVDLPNPGETTLLPPQLNIVPMVQVNHEWKIGGTPMDFTTQAEWEQNGQVQTFAQ